jgi:hypothetical protein
MEQENPQPQQRPQPRKMSLAQAVMSENCIRIAGNDFVSQQNRRCSNSMNRTGSFISSLLF